MRWNGWRSGAQSALVVTVALAAGCQGGTVAPAPHGPGPSAYAIRGTIVGLEGTGLRLATPGLPDVDVAQGATEFRLDGLRDGASFAVAVSRQPTSPWQTCVVANGTGEIASSDALDVAVSCATDTFAVGGTISGLTAGEVVLRTPGVPDLAVAAGDGRFAFAGDVASGSAYDVGVARQPSGWACAVANGAGTVGGADVDGVVVTCSENPFVIGGSISGLTEGGLVLSTPGQPDVEPSAGDTAFAFAVRVVAGTPYSVVVSRHPVGQRCTVAEGAGLAGSTSVTGVAVSCVPEEYSVGGTVVGLQGFGLRLATPNLPDVDVAPGAAEFRLAGLRHGASYAVAVSRQPTSPWQTCVVSNGTGEIASSDALDVAVSCATDTFAVGGTIAGLTAGEVVLRTPGLPDLTVTAGEGTFAFAGRLASGSAYDLGVARQPSGWTCAVAYGAGTVGGADVDEAVVTCSETPFMIGGSVSGLTEGGLVLSTEGQPDVEPSAGDDAFAFAVRVVAGTPYSVVVSRHPVGQRCTVADGAGVVEAASVTDVGVSCAPEEYSVGGRIVGLVGTGLVLGSQAGATLDVSPGATSFVFDRKEPHRAAYSVIVLAQPTAPPQTCRVLDGAGTIDALDAERASVICQSPWSAVASGTDETYAIRPDGSLWAWGENWWGELGDGTRTDRATPVRIGEGFARVAAGGYHFGLGVKLDGTLWAWGNNEGGQLGDGTLTRRQTPVQVGSGFASVSAGYCSVAAIKGDGTLWAWGCNSSGEVGDGTTARRLAPVQIGTGSDWAMVASGRGRTFALKEDGTLWAWGFGALGDGTTSLRPSPVQIGSGFTAIAAGGAHALALQIDGTLWAWGGNAYGEVGDGTLATAVYPTLVGSGYTVIAAGDGRSLAVKSDGTLWAWGRTGWVEPVARDPVPVGTDADWATVSAGGSHAFAFKRDGTLWAWGQDDGALGEHVPTVWTRPVGILGSVVSFAGGGQHSLAVRSDGTLWAWGGNASGQVGDGTTASRTEPVALGDGFVAVAAGAAHSLALTKGGSLWAWGENGRGQLGDGSTVDRAVPVRVSGTFTAVAAGGEHTLALAADGSLWAWGSDQGGQLGVEVDTFSATPLRVGGGFVAIAAGGSHSVALKPDGTLWAWGSATSGQLGLGTGRSAVVPTQVGTGFSAVDAGREHTVAVKTDGTLWAWGSNLTGQIGDGTHEQRTTPVQIGAGFDDVTAGEAHSAALDASGTVWSWGQELGRLQEDGNVPPALQPTPFATGLTKVSAGTRHTLALTRAGALVGWGADDSGQLGVGGGSFRLEPTPVP